MMGGELADSTVRVFPVARIHVNTIFYTREITATCVTNPICDLIIGEIEGVSNSVEGSLFSLTPPDEYPTVVT